MMDPGTGRSKAHAQLVLTGVFGRGTEIIRVELEDIEGGYAGKESKVGVAVFC